MWTAILSQVLVSTDYIIWYEQIVRVCCLMYGGGIVRLVKLHCIRMSSQVWIPSTNIKLGWVCGCLWPQHSGTETESPASTKQLLVQWEILPPKVSCKAKQQTKKRDVNLWLPHVCTWTRTLPPYAHRIHTLKKKIFRTLDTNYYHPWVPLDTRQNPRGANVLTNFILLETCALLPLLSIQ